MEVHLLYGREGKTVRLPDGRVTVITARHAEPVFDEKAALQEALRHPMGSVPLADLAGCNDSVAVVFSDLTRPMPSDRVLPILLAELSQVPRERIVLINALGTHRPNTVEELDAILGRALVERFRVIQHDCHSTSDLVFLGETARGHPIWVNRAYMESSVRILTGFVEPHLFAGFSGGPKAVLPGVAGVETIVANHGVDMIGADGVGFARTEGNPIWEEMREVALRTKPSFMLNVTLDQDRRITGVFAGEMEQAHRAGIEFVRRSAMVPVDGEFDVVIASSGGYPLDISMYQSVKGIVIAASIVKPGGAIILVSECSEGMPGYGGYGDLMRLAGTPDQLLEMIQRPGFVMQDQWDAQIQAQICQTTQVYVHASGLSDEQIRQAMAIPCHDIEGTVAMLLEKYGPQARAAVLPAGPLTVPYVRAGAV